MVAHNHPQQDLTPSSGVSEDSYSVLTYINKINLKKKKENYVRFLYDNELDIFYLVL
jgi:DNA repair protein RadC